MPHIFDPDALTKALEANGIAIPDTVLFADGAYVALDAANAPGDFAAISQQVQDYIGQWTAESGDCDKYARLTHAMAIAAHAREWRKVPGNPPAGLAFGCFAFVLDDTDNGGGGHCINVVITKIEGQNEITARTFEPQTGQEVFLSKTEKQNILWILF